MNLISLVQETQKLRVQNAHIFCREVSVTKQTCLISHVLHLSQQQDHVVSPAQPHLLRKEGQLTQGMHTKQAMMASREEIRLPSIMHACSSK